MSDSNSPSGRIIAAASKVFEFTDALGRVLKIREPGVLDQVRMLRAIGPEQSMNAPYVQVVQTACSVFSIDGVPCPTPTSERQIDAAISRLGDDGFVAITQWLRGQMAERAAAAEAALAEDGDTDKASASPLAVSSSS